MSLSALKQCVFVIDRLVAALERDPSASPDGQRNLAYMKAAADRGREALRGEPQPSTPHRCSGCGHRWGGPLKGAELCGDCWRHAMPTLNQARLSDVEALLGEPPQAPAAIKQLWALCESLRIYHTNGGFECYSRQHEAAERWLAALSVPTQPVSEPPPPDPRLAAEDVELLGRMRRQHVVDAQLFGRQVPQWVRNEGSDEARVSEGAAFVATVAAHHGRRALLLQRLASLGVPASEE